MSLPSTSLASSTPLIAFPQSTSPEPDPPVQLRCARRPRPPRLRLQPTRSPLHQTYVPLTPPPTPPPTPSEDTLDADSRRRRETNKMWNWVMLTSRMEAVKVGGVPLARDVDLLNQPIWGTRELSPPSLPSPPYLVSRLDPNDVLTISTSAGSSSPPMATPLFPRRRSVPAISATTTPPPPIKVKDGWDRKRATMTARHSVC